MSAQTMRELWRSYVDIAFPADMPEAQIEECRLAFYCGAWWLLNELKKASHLGQSEGTKIIRALDDELKANTYDLLQNGGFFRNEATCRVCGCTDSNACPGGCSWVELDRERGLGVCSRCEPPPA